MNDSKSPTDTEQNYIDSYLMQNIQKNLNRFPMSDQQNVKVQLNIYISHYILRL